LKSSNMSCLQLAWHAQVLSTVHSVASASVRLRTSCLSGGLLSNFVGPLACHLC
jgi:hypothetical protein